MGTRQSTKEALAEAILALLKRASLESITVSEIVDECGVSRATFYYHFKDKFELVEWIYMKRCEECLAKHGSIREWREIAYELLSIMEELKVYFASIIGYKGQNSFGDLITKFGLDYLAAAVRAESGGRLTREMEYLLIEWTKGGFFMLEAWILNGMDVPAADMARILVDSAPAKLAAAFDAA